MKTIMLVASGAVVLAAVSGAWAEDKAEAEPTKSVKQLQEDFRKLSFGMFIHYNMATYTGDEWVRGYPDPSTFNPGGMVDTDAWADAAVAAGMKYGVLTTKHVGGFCLWDSKPGSGKRGLAPETPRAPWATWPKRTPGTRTSYSMSAPIGRARFWNQVSRHWRRSETCAIPRRSPDQARVVNREKKESYPR